MMVYIKRLPVNPSAVGPEAKPRNTYKGSIHDQYTIFFDQCKEKLRIIYKTERRMWMETFLKVLLFAVQMSVTGPIIPVVLW